MEYIFKFKWNYNAMDSTSTQILEQKYIITRDKKQTNFFYQTLILMNLALRKD